MPPPMTPTGNESEEYHDSNPSTNLWAGNLSMDTTDSDLMSLFGKYSTIDSVPSYPLLNYAFVIFKHLDDAKKAKESLRGSLVRGNAMKLQFSRLAYSFHADKELLREQRIVRVGIIQNSIALPTTAPFLDQKRVIMEKVKAMIDAGGASRVNILCLQAAWIMPFGLCTREKRWCEFAEPVDGESTQFLQFSKGM